MILSYEDAQTKYEHNHLFALLLKTSIASNSRILSFLSISSHDINYTYFLCTVGHPLTTHAIHDNPTDCDDVEDQ